METTREILSFSPDGTVGVVFQQRLLEDGSWYNMKGRSATPYEMSTKTLETTPEPTAEPTAEVKSGSHNTHARLAPSASKQWTGCTASIAYIEANRHRVPKDTGSSYASEGTDAHDWAAKLLEGQCSLLDIPQEIRKPVGDYATHCMELTPEGVKPMVEVVVPLFYQPTATGTCDFAVLTDSKVIVRDYKHGAGVLVRSEENTQLAIYCMSLIKDMEAVYTFGPDTEIDLAAFQPRHREGADQAPWLLTLADLEAFCKRITEKAGVATEGLERVRGVEWGGTVTCMVIANAAPMTVFAPGEGDDGACRWCDAKAFCDARLAGITESLPDVDPKELLAAMPDLTKTEKKLEPKERLEARDLAPVDDAFLVAVYASTKAFTTYLADVGEYLTKRALAGDLAEGLKLVMGREGNRAWRNEEEAETFLKGQKLKEKERFKFVLKSPTQIEAVLKEKLEGSTRTKNRFAELVTRSAAQKVLALEGDKRESVTASVDLMPVEDEDDAFEI